MDAAHERRRHVGEILVEEGIIGADDLARALAEQSRAPRPLGRVIVELGLASPGAIANALAEQHGGLLKTEYGMSTGITRVAPVAEEEPAAAEETPPPQPTVAEQRPAPPEVSPDVLAAWRQAVGERDEMIRKLAATLKQRDAELARLQAQPAPEPPASVDSPETLERLRRLTEQLETAQAEANAAAEAREAELELLTGEVRARDAELARVRAEHENALNAKETELATLRDRLAAAEARFAGDVERLEAQIRSRDAELAVLRLQAERRAEDEAAEPEPEREHVLFLLRDGGYQVVRRDGPPPAPGELVDGDHVVVRVGASPLPDGPRRCAYLAAR